VPRGSNQEPFTRPSRKRTNAPRMDNRVEGCPRGKVTDVRPPSWEATSMNRSTFFISLFTLCVFACAPLSAFDLTEAHKVYVEQWLEKNDFNQYGDPKDTIYTGGSPLFDETTGHSQDRYEYVLKRHPKLAEELQQMGASVRTILTGDEAEQLRLLEMNLEMAIKDRQLEANKDRPDQDKLDNLRDKIAKLRMDINQLMGHGFTQEPTARFAVAPDVFGEDIGAALDSNDYGRICELVCTLKDHGPDAVKKQAGILFSLNHQLRFRLMGAEGDDAQVISDALVILDPILQPLKV